MACSLIRTLMANPGEKGSPKVAGRIVTTVPKAKELRPYIEKLITMGRKALPHLERAQQFATSAERNSDTWKAWRESDQWNQWNQAVAPALALRRRAFAILRDKDAVDILFGTLAPRFAERPGGYTRVIKLAEVRLGDAGAQALIEFVGDERDRVRSGRRTGPAPVLSDEPKSVPAPEADDSSAKDENKAE